MEKSFLQIINDLIDEKKLDKEKIAVDLEVTRATFYNYLSGATKMPAEILKKVSNYLDVPVGYFFGEVGPEAAKKINQTNSNLAVGKANRQSVTNNGAELELCRKEIDYLKQQIADKEEIIRLLKK